MTCSPSDSSLLRILDANANRVLEGLRVIEEYQRFVLEDAQLSGQLKTFRHDLTTSLRQLPRAERLAARDTENDVGTRLTTPQEAERPDVESILAANFQRVQQSLRVLEEYAKPAWPQLALQAESLRYRWYSLEKQLGRHSPLRHRLADAQLYVLIDGGMDELDFRRRAEGLVDAGTHVLQLRDKQLNDRALLGRARLLRRITRDSQTLFIMNDRADLARIAQADGVHVGQEEITTDEARSILGPQQLVGVSTHSPGQVEQAVRSGADYLGCGPSFPSPTKDFSEFPGLDFLRHVVQRVSLPAFAIGGIHAGNLDQVLAIGVRRVAMHQAIWGADDPGTAARQILQRLPPLRDEPYSPPTDSPRG